MPNRILRKDVFPFTCINPECSQGYDIEYFINVINLRGLIYADCGDTIYQGITCECKKPNLISMPRNNPIVDLRDFIITPNYIDIFANIIEQVIERERSKNDQDFLGFKFIPAWDDETVSYGNILKRYPPSSYGSSGKLISPYISTSELILPYMMTVKDTEKILKQENDTGEIYLRRLYPDIPKFRNLLTCLSPNRISKIDKYEGVYQDGSSISFRDVH